MREEVRRLNDCTCNKVNKYLAFACGLSRNLEGGQLFRLRVTSRFANVPFANVLCCFAKKGNERFALYMLRSLSHDTNKMLYACIYFVLSATDQVKAVKVLPQHISETTSEVSEQDVGETTHWRTNRKPLRGSSNGRCP